MMCYTLNAFIQVLIPETKTGDEQVMMKIIGVLLVDILVKLNPELFGPYVVYKKTMTVLNVRALLRASY